MGQKIKISESELRKLIHEAIDNVVGGNPTNPPSTAIAPAPVAPNMVVNPKYADAIKQTVEDIQNVKTSLERFTHVPGAFYGIPEEKMPVFQTAMQHLETAKNNLLTLLQ